MVNRRRRLKRSNLERELLLLRLCLHFFNGRDGGKDLTSWLTFYTEADPGSEITISRNDYDHPRPLIHAALPTATF